LNDLDELDRIADSAIQLVREETVGKGTEPVRLDTLVRQTCRELAIMKLPVELRSLDCVTVKIFPGIYQGTEESRHQRRNSRRRCARQRHRKNRDRFGHDRR
jgi:hypothetical protein